MYAIFRGVGKSTYSLIPTSLRAENKIHLEFPEKMSINNNESKQVYGESSLLKAFYCIANQNGLPIAYIKDFHDGYTSPYYYEMHENSISDDVIPERLETLCALAQHPRYNGVNESLNKMKMFRYLSSFHFSQVAI